MRTAASSKGPFAAKANLGFVVRGPMETLGSFDERVEALCAELGLKIAFKTASASRLWIKEGDEDRSLRESDE